ncbi:uncharacterized protein Z518_01922 [Rhinocladiella mackenziei CBS 650.93]|uniref:NAD(P)-binding protein n=1 Tax=Rhinocladiella mackenziei CBS 650.93 TaxID=1442369 RepID=A0A0D2IN65_9EURO|nr:uncharacterized protein Z518_01922 [Rhinocladiella mackenziei CBS 650.93]KIX07269.1 hypothetical protein Z518_01922 [Rhinocladiella mackenziei CBS 650.93]
MVKTAIVTGGATGIGLGIVRHLLKKDWRVIIASSQYKNWENTSSTLDASRTTFFQTDVTSWDSNLELFRSAHKWSGGRIDLFVANAGISDLDSLMGQTDLDKDPEQPNMRPTDVNLTSVMWQLKLFIHYSRKTQRDTGTDESRFNPKMIITGSLASIYAFAPCVQYAASKHGLVGLVRSIGPQLLRTDNIALNMTCPSFIPTPLSPKGLKEVWPQHWITKVDIVCRAVDELSDEKGRVVQDGKSDGTDGQIKAGEVVECALDNLWYRESTQYPDESEKFLIEDANKMDGLWAQALAGKFAHLVKTGP